MTYYYRYEVINWTDHKIQLVLHEFPILRKTPCGIKIEQWSGKERFIHEFAKKKFAWPTKEEALISFRARKKRQISILKAQLRKAELALTLEPDEMGYISDELRLDY